MLKRTFPAMCLSLAAIVNLQAADWMRFRGPDGAGVASDQKIPAEFGPEKNLKWKIEVPAGTSSPIIIGHRLFLTSHKDNQRTLHCFDTVTGNSIWERSVEQTHKELATPPAGPSTPTPVSDGERIYVFFPDAGLFAWTMDGEQLWKAPFTASKTMHGLSSSLICVNGKVIQVVDQLNDSYIAAYNSENGEQVWKKERLSGLTGGYSTPAVYQPAGKPPVLITTGPLEAVGYNPETGERIWWLLGKTNAPVSSPVIRGDRLYFCEPIGEPIPMSMLSGMDANKDDKIDADEAAPNPPIARLIARIDDAWGNKDSVVDNEEWNKAFGSFEGKGGLVSVSLGGEGDISETGVRWSFGKALPYIPCILVDQEVVFVVDDGGVVTTVDTETGKQIRKARLKQGSSQYYASPVATKEYVVVVDTKGVLNVVRNAGEWETVSTTMLEEPCFSTPAIANNSLFLRTAGHLFCFSEQ
ncbi:MAG: PQQ-binding-like beta-propeller repeat protein [Planctomyces sp.]|nr:PQQ-binding-like beta-propeller repeat protein [Planctomyces sp.]